MTYLFDSPSNTFSRAEYHIRDLEKQINAFVGEKPWTYVIDDKSTPGQEIHKIRFTQQLPDAFPSIVFDAVNNLRAVLDQCGYAAACGSGKTNPKKTYFPFADDPTSLDDHIRGRKPCRDVPPEIVALFRSFNPYKGGNDALWALNKLCNTKKHCALIPAQIGGASAFISGRLSDARGSTIEFVDPGGNLGWDPQKSEITVFIGGGGFFKTAKSDIAANIAITVVLDGIETQSGKPIISILDAMSSEVDRVLMATEAECLRLGFQLG